MDNEVVKKLTAQIQGLYETFNLDAGTLKLTQEFSTQFKLQPTEQSCIVVPRMAMWLASKQQQIIAIDGSIVYGAGIELNPILMDCQSKGINNIEEILDLGIAMVNDLRTFKNNIGLLQMFYKKLDSIISQVNSEHSQLIKNISWMLFVVIKRQIKVNDVVQSTCILVHVLYLILQQLIPTATTVSKALGDLKKLAILNNEQYQQELMLYLINQFKIKDSELFNLTEQLFNVAYQDLIKQSIIKSLKSTNGFTILAGSIINSNHYKLEQHYRMQLKSDELDERILLPERSKQLTPKKMTPLIKSTNIKHLQMQQKGDYQRDQTQNPTQTRKFQKVLNYEFDQKITINTNLKEIKLPQHVMMSPYAQQQVIATPMSEAMEMYNWIHDKQTPFKKYLKNTTMPSLQQFCLQDPVTLQWLNQQTNLHSMIDQFFNQMIQYCESSGLIDQNKSKRNLYWTLFMLLLEKQGVPIDDPFLKSLLTVVIECVNFILNKSSQLLDQLILKCQISHFQIWRQLDFLLNSYDPKIPYQLKEHFLDTETKLVSYSIWACDSQSDLISFLNEMTVTQQQQNPTMNRLFKRVLHYCAYQIQTIGNNLKLNEQIQECIWITVKYIICERAEQLRNHSLDQIVLASTYAILKITGTMLKFQQIINAYEQTNSWYSKQFIKKMVCNVYINHDTMGDIVQYYNQAFIPQVKSFIVKMTQEMKQNTQQIPQSPIINKNPALNNKILSSPLRDVLPRAQQQKHLMTPSTQLLYAYQESPLLKQQPKVQSKENMNTSNMPNQHFINKPKPNIVKSTFSILAQGTPKILVQAKTSRNNSFMNQNNNNHSLQQQNMSAHSQTETNSTFCKLLNFEQ